MAQKIKVLCDLGCFSKLKAKTGIANVAHNVWEGMSQHPQIDLTMCLSGVECSMLTIKDELKNEKILDLQSNLEKLVVRMELFINSNQFLKKNRLFRLPLTGSLITLKGIARRIIAYSPRKKRYAPIESYDAYLSLEHLIPKGILNKKNIKKYAVIYDILPLVSPDYAYINKPGSMFRQLATISQESLNTTHYFSISQYTKQDMLNNIKNIDDTYVTVIPLGTSDYFYHTDDKTENNRIKEKYKIPKDKKYILSLGTKDSRKNHLFSIRNFLVFIDKHHIEDIVFVVAGSKWQEGQFLAKLEELMEKHPNHKDKIIMAGFVDDEDLASLFSFAEVFAYPSTYEGFGLPVIEAMKCGCPVITSNVTSLPEVAGQAAIEVNPYSDEEMLEAYEKIFFNENLKSELIQKGLERSKAFTWKACTDAIVKKIKEDYRDVKENKTAI